MGHYITFVRFALVPASRGTCEPVSLFGVKINAQFSWLVVHYDPFIHHSLRNNTATYKSTLSTMVHDLSNDYENGAHRTWRILYKMEKKLDEI